MNQANGTGSDARERVSDVVLGQASGWTDEQSLDTA
jgi:hypothetical protein